MTGPMRLSFTLSTTEHARIDVLDLAGRRVVHRALEGLAPGTHSVELRERLPAGIYVVQLTQGARHARAKVCIVR